MNTYDYAYIIYAYVPDDAKYKQLNRFLFLRFSFVVIIQSASVYYSCNCRQVKIHILTVVACAEGCETCIMSGAGKCDGPQCADGYYLNSNFLCTRKFLFHFCFQ